MNIGDDEIEVELPDAAEEPAVEVAKTGEAAPSVEDGIDELKAQLKAEKDGREAAERRAIAEANRAQEAAQRADTASKAARDSDLNLVTGAIDQLKAAQDLLEERYADAAAAGDHRAMAKITREFTTNGAKLEQLELGKQEMERAPQVQPRQEERREYSNDPAEQMASQMDKAGYSRSAKWIRDHPDYARNPALTRKMMAAHNLADADGIQADTDAYFEAIETTLGMRGREQVQQGQQQEQETPRQRQSAPPAAPSSRAASTTGGNGSSNRIRLSAEEVEIAEMMGMTPQEYAKNKIALKSEGKLN